MREILFRGKRERNKWIYGWLVSQHRKCTDGELLSEIQSNTFGEGRHYVDTKTVGQFTGLIDKNGKKIFEGDIIKGKNKATYAVEYRESIASFTTSGTGVLTTPCVNRGTMVLYEVIGNIYDNPELLGGTEND